MKNTLALIATLTLLAGCSGGKASPTEPEARTASASNCASGCDGVVRAPSQYDADVAMSAARDAVRRSVESGEIFTKRKPDWEAFPRIEWQACFFYVANGYSYDSAGNRIDGGCAAGMTDYNGKRIVIATQDSGRAIPLVKWEASNYFLIAIGREDLCDKWQNSHPV